MANWIERKNKDAPGLFLPQGITFPGYILLPEKDSKIEANYLASIISCITSDIFVFN